MTRQHTVTVLDDFDGSEGAKTIRFGLDDRWYQVDLSEEHEAELREFMRRYVDAAVEGGKSGASAKPTSDRNSHEIRKWLVANNVPISARGRIPNVYLAMYDRKEVDPAFVSRD